MNYKGTYQVYTNDQAFDLDSPCNVVVKLKPTLIKSKTFMGDPKSDLYSAPYILSFNVYLKTKPSSPLLIHSIVLADGQSNIVAITPKKPFTVPFEEWHFFQASYATNLNDRLTFTKNRKLKLTVDWEIPGTKDRQKYETELRGEKHVVTHPIGESS